MSSTAASSPIHVCKSCDIADNELQSLQILQCYSTVVLNDLPTLTYSRPERDWDRFFERLEEKFLLANVPIEYKEKLARRLMRGLILQTWATNAAVPGSTYEQVRDKTVLSFFPKPTEFQRLLRIMTPPTTETTEPQNEESGDSVVAPRGGRRPGSSVSSIRSQLAVHRARIERCISRHPSKQMPPDSDFVQMAIGLMRPALLEQAQGSAHKGNLEAFLNEMAELEAQRQESLIGTERARRVRPRRVRPRRNN